MPNIQGVGSDVAVCVRESLYKIYQDLNFFFYIITMSTKNLYCFALYSCQLIELLNRKEVENYQKTASAFKKYYSRFLVD